MSGPIIAICMGDPAGIGPEVTIKTLLDTATYQHYRPFVTGDPKVMGGYRPGAAFQPGVQAHPGCGGGTLLATSG